ncbi:MAG: hypothetical protein JNK99_10240 [Candidatus Accumulibacter sp.]|jgi:hypothetical protein|uniref:hypothetical protein n=1 Tax=Accumulibacter sp. TaxID=2053492 RepID=UPI001A4DC60D|nr:hypothetical protein [Accumulibacter sp.]MBL8395110.1 hypothetical protein [Accumulibacter sp.]
MNDREARRYDMFGRVQTFGRNHFADFANGSKAAGHFARLAQIVRDLTTERARQGGGTATAKQVLIDELRLDLQNIARTARAIGAGEAGFADKFRVPENSSQGALLGAADAFSLALDEADVAGKFIAYEMPATFVQDLKDDLATIRAADSEMDADDLNGVASTAAVGRLIREGMAEVRQLDAIMNNKYARNPDKLRAWESASHVERAPQREKKAAGDTLAPPPSPAAR